MKLRRRSLLCAPLLCAFFVGVAAPARGCVKEPSESQARIDKVDREPAVRETPETGPAEREAVERERVAAPAFEPLAVPTPHRRLAGDGLFKQAYEDVYRILSAENECSRFYGGAAPAVHVFNQLAGRMKAGRLDGARTAGQMGGGEISVIHAPSGLRFRLFAEAVINADGPFYKSKPRESNRSAVYIGSQAPDTRGARALILLHELGHLVKGADGQWLLPDDGRESALSEQNTAVVEEKCGRQIKSLGSRDERTPAVASSARDAAERDTSEQ